MPSKKKVSVGWQCAAILLVPAGIWAFYRIKKLRYGVLVYLAAFGLKLGIPLGLAVIFSNSDSYSALNIFDSLSTVGFFASLGFSMWFMSKWSNRWNESVDRENAQSSII